MSTTLIQNPPAAVVSPPLDWQASVPTALALGWQLSDLFAMAGEREDRSAAEGNGRVNGLPPLATIDQWPACERWDLAVRQIEAKASPLKVAFDQVGTDTDGLEQFIADLDHLIGQFQAPTRGAQVDCAYRALVMTLAAAHARLGRACELGCGLADICRLGSGACAAKLAERFGAPVIPLQAALSDLASSLPPHSSRSVSLSLAQWKKWSTSKKLAVPPANELADVLRRQGELWRAVLAGEKLGQDMLAAEDYLEASKTLFRSLVRKRPWIWVTFASAGILIAVGIYFILTASDTLKALSGAGLSVLSAVGITAASIKRSATEVGDRLISEVWSAELDWAIADAVTVGPTGWRVKLRKVEMPPRGPGRTPPRKKPASGDSAS
jgi:hypothetical protein